MSHLEPTEAQLKGLINALEWYEDEASLEDGGTYKTFDGKQAAKAAFALVRDMVLDEVQRRIVRIAIEDAPNEAHGSALRFGGDRYFFVSGISMCRKELLAMGGTETAMKGTP